MWLMASDAGRLRTGHMDEILVGVASGLSRLLRTSRRSLTLQRWDFLLEVRQDRERPETVGCL